jgi:glycerophosphoryl diester phosphodiesterase
MTGSDPTRRTRHPWFAGEHPRVLAHRGFVSADDAGHGIVENSFLAVAGAHALGVGYVESDCHLTRDGVPVLFHDEDLARVTGDPRAVAAVTLRELDGIMADRGGLITLAQALDSFPDLRFNLDVKAADAAAQVGATIAPYAERVLLTSFSDARRREALRAAEAAGAEMPPATSAGSATVARLLGALAVRSSRLAGRLLAGVDALQVPERRGRVRILTPRLVETAHRFDVEVHVWTVNEVTDMERLLDLGVDGIVTDQAHVALKVAERRR